MSSISNVSSSLQTQQLQQTARHGKGQERLFQKADTDGSGGVDSTELQSMLDHVSKKTGVSLDVSSTELLSKADANSDGTLDSTELKTAMESVLPAPSTMDFAAQTGQRPPPPSDESEVSADAQTLSDSLQALKELFKSADTDGNASLTETELNAFVQKLLTQYTQVSQGGTSTATGSTLNASV
jgi:Ca2+-binding EF-hand superfamily protein